MCLLSSFPRCWHSLCSSNMIYTRAKKSNSCMPPWDCFFPWGLTYCVWEIHPCFTAVSTIPSGFGKCVAGGGSNVYQLWFWPDAGRRTQMHPQMVYTNSTTLFFVVPWFLRLGDLWPSGGQLRVWLLDLHLNPPSHSGLCAFKACDWCRERRGHWRLRDLVYSDIESLAANTYLKKSLHIHLF